ncbi:MAG: hypothetical protein SH850_00820 [Planctomycetaceae bacterium]|nr:hypothetical protein [Planctomycetaceae bacterium]
MQLNLDPADLRPLVQAVVAEVVATMQADSAKLGDRLAFNEAEAARLLSLEPHVLRDERLRGRVGASQIVGRRVRYTKQDLTTYLAGRRYESEASR